MSEPRVKDDVPGAHVASVEGFPMRFPNWKWGMEYEEIRPKGDPIKPLVDDAPAAFRQKMDELELAWRRSAKFSLGRGFEEWKLTPGIGSMVVWAGQGGSGRTLFAYSMLAEALHAGHKGALVYNNASPGRARRMLGNWPGRLFGLAVRPTDVAFAARHLARNHKPSILLVDDCWADSPRDDQHEFACELRQVALSFDLLSAVVLPTARPPQCDTGKSFDQYSVPSPLVRMADYMILVSREPNTPRALLLKNRYGATNVTANPSLNAAMTRCFEGPPPSIEFTIPYSGIGKSLIPPSHAVGKSMVFLTELLKNPSADRIVVDMEGYPNDKSRRALLEQMAGRAHRPADQKPESK